MADKLKQCFPMIREREEIRRLIESDWQSRAVFESWNKEQQEEFLDMCCGIKGVKILYDAFFKEIMNPEYAPERLSEFLSLLLGKKVRIHSVLPNDSTRVTDEASLLITDIVVEMEDGSLANVEVQKIGYLFPGERSACYSADLLLRQYRRIRSREKKQFSYKDIKSVYNIVLFEKSPREFHAYPQKHLHFFEQKSDTGLEIELLQKYIFIPLDIFRKTHHNKHIGNKLDAWLTFLCEDAPETVVRLIEDWPEFKPMYEEVYNLCRNIQEVMKMFSKELLELDRGTVQYMIDEMQDELEEQKKKLEEQKKELEELVQKTAEVRQQVEQEKQKVEEEKQRAEQLEQRAAQEKQRAAQEKQRAEQLEQRAAQEKQRAEQLEQRAAQEKQRAEQLEQKAAQEKQRAEQLEQRTAQEKQRAEQLERRAAQEKQRAEQLERRVAQEKQRAEQEKQKAAEENQKLRQRIAELEVLSQERSEE